MTKEMPDHKEQFEGKSRDGVLEAVALTSRCLEAGNCRPWPWPWNSSPWPWSWPQNQSPWSWPWCRWSWPWPWHFWPWLHLWERV